MNTTLRDEAVIKMQDIIMDQLAVTREQVTPEARIVDDLCADSLDVVEISLKVEEEFNVTLPDERLEGVRTFGELCEELGMRLANGQS